MCLLLSGAFVIFSSVGVRPRLLAHARMISVSAATGAARIQLASDPSVAGQRHDDTAGQKQLVNVLGRPLHSCSCLGSGPVTGFFRDGFCRTDEDHDHGVHTVCAVMTAEFLAFTRRQGNDLSTPRPWAGFAGLKPGDHWCLCAARWKQAAAAGCAPPVMLEACHAETLQVVALEELQAHAFSDQE